MAAYNELPNRGKALLNTAEWCVLASIVCEDTNTDKLWVVSLATGSKCVGPKMINTEPRGYVLHDCHAEVLAKRAFTLALLEEMKSGAGRLLVHSSSISSPSLRPGLKFHLYVTESPCGDAAIYNVDGESTPTFTGAKAIGTASSSTSSTSTMSTTTTTTTTTCTPIPVREPESQALSRFRLKSGRSNIPTPYRSLSHCCSDKILRWSILGLGGSLVQSISPPPLLSSVVVVGDPRCISSVDSQQASLTRAITSRGGCPAYVIPYSSTTPPWELSRMAKQTKFKKVSPSGMSINYIYTDYKAGKGGSSNTEIIVGATGLRQEVGKKKRKLSSPPTSPNPPTPSFSRLCRRELLNLALAVSSLKPPPTSTYQEAKKSLNSEAHSKKKEEVLSNPLKNW
eukprot:CAMPEP_0118657874 /NCGR_PEP_ID=MMETSP0785-20121206/14258_1 /TAXON_ID=91992 /ORGANISM="Bolidomonas pacifica, Strain CCMP 1866" /LENGTH=396 /DNA_ID=CAMNT_0006550835 /DNA_START=106 /DNA_END=1293 /DNA_ORIENTATION=+